jgi:ATP-dependent protease ClpP protease subunit
MLSLSPASGTRPVDSEGQLHHFAQENFGASAETTLNELHLHFHLPINAKSIDALRHTIIDQLPTRPTKLVVYMSSGGGVPSFGVEMYSFLQSLSIDTCVYNMGSIESAAVTVFMGFKERYATPASHFMTHKTRMNPGALSGDWVDEDYISAAKGLTLSDNKSMAVIAEVTKLPMSEIIPIFGAQQTILTPQLALDMGFVQAIRTPTLPPNTHYVTLEAPR